MGLFEDRDSAFDWSVKSDWDASLQLEGQPSLGSPAATSSTLSPSPTSTSSKQEFSATTQGWSLTDQMTWAYFTTSSPSAVDGVGSSSSGSGAEAYGSSTGFNTGGSTSGFSASSSSTVPVVTSESMKVPQDDGIAGLDLLRAEDDGYITRFRFKDSVGGGYFVLDGQKLIEDQWYNLRVDQLDGLVYMASDNVNRLSREIDDEVAIRARDDEGNWSDRKNIVVTSVHNANRPITSVLDQEVRRFQVLNASELFSSRDQDGNTIKRYRVMDLSTAPLSGRLLFDGQTIAAKTWFEFDASELDKLQFIAGDGTITDRIRVGSFDGRYWGYDAGDITTLGRPTIEVGRDFILDELRKRDLAPLVRQTDNGPPVVAYQIYDANTDPLSARLIKGIDRLQDGVIHTLTVDELQDIEIQGGNIDDRSLDDFYIRLSNGQEWSRWEKLTVRTEPNYITSLAAGSWKSFIGDNPLVLTYSFLQQVPAYYDSGATERTNFQLLSENMREGARRALQYWEDVANIRFVEVPDSIGGIFRFGTADLPDDVGAWAYFPAGSDPINQGLGGDVWLNNNGYPDPDADPLGSFTWFSHDDQTEGRYGFQTMLHELGHALGLKHPFSGNPLLPASTDSEQFTVMSYTNHPTAPRKASSPMLYDIAAIQQIYGPNPTFNNGDDVYQYDTAVVKTIYDTGGDDTLDASNLTTGVRIDLRPGSFSDYGRGTNNLGIAFNTMIENAIGSSRDDELVGNDLDNFIQGGDGDDILHGLGGEDTLVGGGGDDTYRYRVTDGLDRIADGGDGVDALELLSNVPGTQGIDDFTLDLEFAKLNGNLEIHLALNDGTDYEGYLVIEHQDWARSQIETLRLFDVSGNQIGVDVDLTSVFDQASSARSRFVVTDTDGTYGKLVAPV